MTEGNAPLETVLCVYPIAPNLVEKLRTVFPTVLFWPQKAGNDYGSTSSNPLPPDSAYAQCDVLMCFHLPTNLTNYKQTPRLRLLQAVGAGYTQITQSDYYKSFPEDHPLTLANTTGIHVPAISEHVMMTVMMLNHKVQQIQDICRVEKRWAAPTEFSADGLFVKEIRQQTFGIVGYGHLGREIGRLAKDGFHCRRLLACSREGRPKKIAGYLIPGTGDVEGTLPDEYFSTLTRESTHAFLAQCDVVVNCLPQSDETKGFLGREEFKAMRNDAIIVNIGRGDTMDQDALVEALQAKGERDSSTGSLLLGGASLDVTSPEPLPDGHPLFSLQNVVLTPHVSWASVVNFERACEVLVRNKDRMDRGLGAINAVRGKRELDQ